MFQKSRTKRKAYQATGSVLPRITTTPTTISLQRMRFPFTLVSVQNFLVQWAKPEPSEEDFIAPQCEAIFPKIKKSADIPELTPLQDKQ